MFTAVFQKKRALSVVLIIYETVTATDSLLSSDVPLFYDSDVAYNDESSEIRIFALSYST